MLCFVLLADLAYFPKESTPKRLLPPQVYLSFRKLLPWGSHPRDLLGAAILLNTPPPDQTKSLLGFKKLALHRLFGWISGSGLAIIFLQNFESIAAVSSTFQCCYFKTLKSLCFLILSLDVTVVLTPETYRPLWLSRLLKLLSQPIRPMSRLQVLASTFSPHD